MNAIMESLAHGASHVRYGVAGEDAPLQALRELIEAVIVEPAAPGAPIPLKVRGRLSALVDGDLFPDARLVANGRGFGVVAEDRLLRYPPLPAFTFTCLAA